MIICSTASLRRQTSMSPHHPSEPNSRTARVIIRQVRVFFVYSAYAEAFLQKASGGIDIFEVPLSEGYSTIKSDDCANARVLIQALLDQLAEENPSMGNAPELLCQSNLEFHDVPDCTKAMNLFDTVEGYLDNSYTTPTTFLEKLRAYGDQKAWVAEYRWDLNSGSTQCDGCPQPTDGQDAAALHGDGATFVPNDGKQVLHIDGSIDSYMSLDTLKLGGGPFTACARISLDRYPGTNENFFPWEFGIGQYHMQQIFMEIRHESDVTTNSMNIVMILSVENRKRNEDDLHFSRLYFRISENEFQLNTWHHVCSIIEDTNNRDAGRPNPNPMKIYLNGVAVAECTENCVGTSGIVIDGQVPNRLLRTQNFIGRSAFGGSAFSTKYGESVFAGMLSNLVVIDGAAWGAADVQAEMEIAAEAATTTSTSTSTSTTIDLRAAEDLKSPTNESDKETTIRFDVNIEKETVKKKFVKELVGGGAAIIALIIMYVINWYAKKQGMEGTPITCGKVEFRGFDIKLNCCNCSTAAKEELEDFPYYHGEVEEEQGMEKNEGGLKKAKEVLKNRTPGDFIVIKFITANPLQKKYRLFVLKESGGAEAAAEPTLFIKLKQAHIDGPWLFSKVTQPVTLEPNFDKHKETGCSFLNDAIEHIVNLTDELNSSCLTETENGIEIEGREFACFDFSQSESTADNNPTKARKRPPSKFVANAIRLGQATQSAAGLADLMGYTTMSIMGLIFGNGGGVEAILHEVTMSGTEEDKKNLKGLMDGTYTNPPHSDGSPQTPEELAAQSLTLDELMQTDQVKTAKLQRAHVLSLRLYTTPTFASMNNPLRTTPPTKPHPLAVTTYFASEGIKLLRSVAGNLPNAHKPQDFWRGMKDLTISAEFLKSGGTEFACMSTSTSQEMAIDFAWSKAPMIVKLETKDFMSRGADISFLSVYPGEFETLFPPLTFLRPIGSEKFVKNGIEYLLVRCEPVIP